MADVDTKAASQVQALGGTAIKPVGWDRTGWEAFKYMLYDPDTGEVLTRTPLSWLKITVFYCIYYSCLAGFWIGCLNIFFLTLPESHQGPRWTTNYSLIGVNPGVGLRPRNNDDKIDSQMFVLKAGDNNTFMSERKAEGELNADYAHRTKNFLGIYNITTMGANYKGPYPTFNLKSSMGDCAKFPYGYVATNVTKVEPCIFVKLNAIWGWEPTPYDCAAQKEKCPESLRKHLAGQHAKDAGKNNIWIDCKGRYAADQEALIDNIEYFPKGRNLPIEYFPYQGKKKDEWGNIVEAYHSPLVAIKIKSQEVGQLLHVECRAFYHGVVHSTKNKEGLVQFEVQIKNDY